MAGPKKFQVLIELDLATKNVTITGPMSHPDVVLKMLASASSQVADLVAGMREELEGKPKIHAPPPGLTQKLQLEKA